MTTYARINCPACGKPIEQSAWQCQFCGEDVVWALEDRRLAKEYLRYAGAALIGSALLSMAFLIPFGFLAMFPALMIPLWVALVALGAAVWLVAGSFTDVSAPVGADHRPQEPMPTHKKNSQKY